jgi:hypothetical protein
MADDLSAALAVARTVSTQQSVALAVVKKNHEMEMAFAQAVDQVARAAPPPGQGQHVDKVA